jgi:hypothetical protein
MSHKLYKNGTLIMKPHPVIYKIYCPGCKNLWILKAPEEVTDAVYNAWMISVNAEHAYFKEMKNLEKPTDQKHWWEFWK